MENLGRKMLSRMLKIWVRKCYLGSRIWGLENLGWKMLSLNSNLGGGVENLGRKCYLESRIWVVENLGWKMLSRIWGVENLGRKMLSRISNLGGWKIWGGKCYLECGKFGVENAISNLEFGVWRIWGGKCYLETPI